MYMYEEKDVQEVQGGNGEGEGVGGIAKMYILLRLKCNPHAIPHADIRGCMEKTIVTMHDLPAHRSRPPPAACRVSTRTHSIFKKRLKVFGLPRENILCSVLQTFSKCTDALSDACKNWPQQLCKLGLNFEIIIIMTALL